MSAGEKTTLLPTAPEDARITVGSPDGYHRAPDSDTVAAGGSNQQEQDQGQARFVVMDGIQFDPSRKYRYGLHALSAAIFILISMILVELRDCEWGPGIDLKSLQALHLALMIAAFALYILSLFGIADFLFQFRFLFVVGVLMVYALVCLMVWMVYEAAVNTCVKSSFLPLDFSIEESKNVFSNGDGVGIIVLLLDIFATLLMVSAGTSFYKRY